MRYTSASHKLSPLFNMSSFLQSTDFCSQRFLFWSTLIFFTHYSNFFLHQLLSHSNTLLHSPFYRAISFKLDQPLSSTLDNSIFFYNDIFSYFLKSHYNWTYRLLLIFASLSQLLLLFRKLLPSLLSRLSYSDLSSVEYIIISNNFSMVTLSLLYEGILYIVGHILWLDDFI